MKVHLFAMGGWIQIRLILYAFLLCAFSETGAQSLEKINETLVNYLKKLQAAKNSSDLGKNIKLVNVTLSNVSTTQSKRKPKFLNFWSPKHKKETAAHLYAQYSSTALRLTIGNSTVTYRQICIYSGVCYRCAEKSTVLSEDNESNVRCKTNTQTTHHF